LVKKVGEFTHQKLYLTEKLVKMTTIFFERGCEVEKAIFEPLNECNDKTNGS
jgi:hypothetical protein